MISILLWLIGIMLNS